MKKTNFIAPPQVSREGTKKTVFANFEELCISMNRNTTHVQQFILAELGVFGSQDGGKRLIIRGRFQPIVRFETNPSNYKQITLLKGV
jgi:translation initiation factor 2 subunit 2